jgi:outer membrane protein assembly factor BamB
MAIKVQGTTVIDDNRNFTNINSITFADGSVQSTANPTIPSLVTVVSGGIELNNVNQFTLANGSVIKSSDLILQKSASQGEVLRTLNNPNAYGTSADDLFGVAVAISGNYVIVGTQYEDDAGGSGSGKAYIFNATTGQLVHTLNNPNAYGTSAGDWFGASVAISGNYAIVGAPTEADAGGTFSGKAYIYNVTTGTLLWTLNNPNAYGTSASDTFAASVEISGNYAIVGTGYLFFGSEDDAGGTSSGKAYIFNVTTGQLVHTLNNPNAYGTSAGDTFGYSVAISGNYAIVGAPSEDDATGTNSGKAYIFNAITGQLVHTLNNPNAYGTSADDNFAYSVAISGNYAIVGAQYEDDAGGTSSGKAYIFNVTTGQLVHTLNNPNAYGTSADDNFGRYVAISGNYAIVAAASEDTAISGNGGRVYIYSVITGELLRTASTPSERITGAVSASDNYFIISGAVLFVGENDAGGNQSGRVHIFATKDLTYLDRAYTLVS